MPLSGVQPLSLGEYGAAGAATGYGAAGNDLQSLAQAFAQGPMLRARGEYLGAETGRAQAQTGVIHERQRDMATWQGVMQDPNWIRDPAKVAYVGSIMSKYPEDAVNFGKIMSAQAQGQNYATGGGTPGGQRLADVLSAGTGTSTWQGTATGGRELGNIAAGPGYAAAAASRYGADQQLKGHMATVAEQAREYDTGTHPALGPGGLPGLFTQSQLSGGGYGPVSETALAANQTYGPVVLPGNAGTGFAPPATPGVRPIITSDQGLGMILSGQVPSGQGGITGNGPADLTPSPAAPGPAQTSQAPSSPSLAAPPRPGAPGSPGNVPSTGNPTADALLRQKLGIVSAVPPAREIDPAKLDAMITTSLAKNLIAPDQTTGWFAVHPQDLQMDPQVRAAVLARVTELTHSDDPVYKNQPDVAIERAIQDLKPNLTLDPAHTLNPINREAVNRLPTVRWTPTQDGAATPAPAPAVPAAPTAPPPASVPAAPPVAVAPTPPPLAATFVPQPPPVAGGLVTPPSQPMRAVGDFLTQFRGGPAPGMTPEQQQQASHTAPPMSPPVRGPAQTPQVTPAQAIAQARAAVAQGANPAAVAQRLRALGIDPSILTAGP
jgi:hypothetical protein